MKRLSFLLLCAVLIVTACSDNDPKSALKKNELGLIVPQNNESENLILLEDGTLTRPVSGITDFNTRAIGDKLLISYRTKGVDHGVTNIDVTRFAEANDSIFTPEPEPDPIDLEDAVYGSTFSGRYYIANEDSTQMYVGNITLTFGNKQLGNSAYSYTIDPDGESSFSGEGEFEITDGFLYFSDNDHETIIVPLGEFVPSLGIGSLYLWPTEFNGLYFTYALTLEE